MFTFSNSKDVGGTVFSDQYDPVGLVDSGSPVAATPGLQVRRTLPATGAPRPGQVFPQLDGKLLLMATDLRR